VVGERDIDIKGFGNENLVFITVEASSGAREVPKLIAFKTKFPSSFVVNILEAHGGGICKAAVRPYSVIISECIITARSVEGGLSPDEIHLRESQDRDVVLTAMRFAGIFPGPGITGEVVSSPEQAGPDIVLFEKAHQIVGGTHVAITIGVVDVANFIKAGIV
jgi:hypothetical protein